MPLHQAPLMMWDPVSVTSNQVPNGAWLKWFVTANNGFGVVHIDLPLALLSQSYFLHVVMKFIFGVDGPCLAL